MTTRMRFTESDDGQVPLVTVEQPSRRRRLVAHAADQTLFDVIGMPEAQPLRLVAERVAAESRFDLFPQRHRSRSRLTIPGPRPPIEDAASLKGAIGKRFGHVVHQRASPATAGERPEGVRAVLAPVDMLRQLMAGSGLI